MLGVRIQYSTIISMFIKLFYFSISCWHYMFVATPLFQENWSVRLLMLNALSGVDLELAENCGPHNANGNSYIFHQGTRFSPCHSSLNKLILQKSPG